MSTRDLIRKIADDHIHYSKTLLYRRIKRIRHLIINYVLLLIFISFLIARMPSEFYKFIRDSFVLPTTLSILVFFALTFCSFILLFAFIKSACEIIRLIKLRTELKNSLKALLASSPSA
jgi:hypothetical protein